MNEKQSQQQKSPKMWVSLLQKVKFNPWWSFSVKVNNLFVTLLLLCVSLQCEIFSFRFDFRNWQM